MYYAHRPSFHTLTVEKERLAGIYIISFQGTSL